MNISWSGLECIDPRLLRLYKSSDSFIKIGNAMIIAGIKIAALEDQLQDRMACGRLQSSVEMEAQQLFVDELMEPILKIFADLERLREDIQFAEWDDRDGVIE